MPIVPQFDSSKLKELRAALKEVDADLTKQMNKEIKQAVQPMAQRLQGSLPSAPILSGMNHNGERSGMKSIKATAYGPARKSLARIEVFSKPNAGGFKIADLAGTRNQLSNRNRGYTRNGPSGPVTVRAHATSSGQALINALEAKNPLLGRGGRFGWRNFIAERPQLVRDVVKIIDKFCDMTVKKVVS
jgi:hypothetical protein